VKSLNMKIPLWLLISVSPIFSACAMNPDQPIVQAKQNAEILSGTAWWVEDIAGQGVIDASHTTIEFDGAGKITGDAGCNLYFGSVEVTDTSIKVGQLGSTRKMCPEALMNQETAFFKAIDAVTSWELADTDLLHLRDANSKDQIRASRTKNP
jgi:heat shock protein HslJ